MAEFVLTDTIIWSYGLFDCVKNSWISQYKKYVWQREDSFLKEIKDIDLLITKQKITKY